MNRDLHWYTAAALAEFARQGIPKLPNTERAVQILAKREGWQTRLDMAGNPMARKRKGRGGGWEYSEMQLSLPTRVWLAKRRAKQAAADAVTAPRPRGMGEAWRWFEGLSEKKRKAAEDRLRIIAEIESLRKAGLSKADAVAEKAVESGIGQSTIYSWFQKIAGLKLADRLPTLAPGHTGKLSYTAECDAGAWEFLKTAWLRPERPNFEKCYRDLHVAAQKNGWKIPPARTLRRRVEREIPVQLRVLKRDGEDALRALYPWQERDRTKLHALEAVNADCHTADVMVEWPNGKVDRPTIIAIQDLYSNKILAWRVDLSPSAEGVRLALYDMFRDWGIPDLAFLDNGREFAAKQITGGQKTRYRFKVKPGDMDGVMTALGVEVHWTKPYSGQSKPIERAFREFCEEIWKGLEMARAYTGNSPMNKPANYGERAIKLADFIEIFGRGVQAYNARPERNTAVCQRRMSFDEAFTESYREWPVRKASDAQLRLAMLASEVVTARRPNGSVHVMGSRYWAEFLNQQIGRKVVARYDPDDLAAGVHVYRLDGGLLGFAECWEAGPFFSAGERNEHERERRKYVKAVKAAAAFELRYSVEDIVSMMPDVAAEAEPPEAKVVRVITGNTARKARLQPQETIEVREEKDRLFFEQLGAGLRIVEAGEE